MYWAFSKKGTLFKGGHYGNTVFAPEDNAMGLYIFCVLKDFDPFGAQIGENQQKGGHFLQIHLS